MTKKEKEAVKAENVATLNEWSSIDLLISRIKNDVYGNSRYCIRFISKLNQMTYMNTIFNGLTSNRVTANGVTVQDSRGIDVAAAEFEQELRDAGVTVPVIWFKGY